MLRKPNWLKAEDWTELLRKHGGIPRCAETGSTENLTVDHIKPRHLGGGNDIGNLQFLIAPRNISKGIGPDKYWSGQFYFDQHPNMENARTAQNDAFNEIIARSNWFSQPISQISGLIYVHAWIVGAGKTLGMLTNACAVNSVIRHQWGDVRRADRMLVLTKERAIRDQIANDFETDSTGRELFPIAPKVGVVEDGYQFDDVLWINKQQIIVACIQQLFTANDSDLAALLHRFPIISIDELHWGYEQVARITEAATTSLCFGYSGTPTERNLEQLNKLVLVTVHGYQEADQGDRSLKYLTDAEPDQFIKELTIKEAEMMVRGQMATVFNSDQEGYDKNIIPPLSVALTTIAEAMKRDALCLNMANEISAVHRNGIEGGVEVTIGYPSHPLIICENIAFAEIMEKNINKFFDANRSIYPERKGWRAEVVFTGGENEDGSRRKQKPLKQDHPWMRCYKNKGQLDNKCARVLVAVNMCREGVNNPYCGPVGLACRKATPLADIQGTFGRQARSVVMKVKGVPLGVPPAALDSMLVVTHEVYENRDALISAIKFMMHMDDHFEKYPTISTLEKGEEPAPVQPSPDVIELPPKAKIDIAAILGGGGTDVDGWPVGGDLDDDDLIIATVVGSNPDLIIQPTDDLKTKKEKEKRLKPLRDLISGLRKNPTGLRDMMELDEPLQQVSIVFSERIRREPTAEEMREFLRAHHPDLLGEYNPQLRIFEVCYEQHYERLQLPTLVSGLKLEDIRRSIVRQTTEKLGHHYKGDDGLVHKLVGSATKKILGVPDGESARKNTKWDCPECQAVLIRPDIKNQIQRWVIGRLIDQGMCPSLPMSQQAAHAAE